MSYWVYLEKDGETVGVNKHADGGTFVLGGTNEAELNVTYNYSKHYSVNDINGKKAKDTVKELQEKVNEFGTERDNDYWASTKGNVGYALNILLGWAKQHPEAVWRIS